MKRIAHLTLAALVALYGSIAEIQGQTSKLTKYNVDTSKLSVSGISSGACFATQFHVAYSSIIMGMGSWAGTPFNCYTHWLLSCMNSPSIIDVDKLKDDTLAMGQAGEIDPTGNMLMDKVYIHHGADDTTVRPLASEKMQEYYLNFVNPNNVVLKNDLAATHCITTDYDIGEFTRCGTTNSKLYIEDCDYDSVTAMFTHFFGTGVNSPNSPGSAPQGSLVKFDQTEFFPSSDADAASMDDEGYIYVPANCRDGVMQCKLHIFFHGCSMNFDELGTDFITDSGFEEVADANNIIIMFPQTIKLALGNPFGCWNWFGYNSDLAGGDFAKKDAIQMKGMYDMLARAAGL